MDINKALSEIGEIRSQMARQELFQGFGPVAVVCSGLLALLVAAAQGLWPEALAGTQQRFVLVWVGATFVASIFITAHMWRRSNNLHGTQSGVLLNRVFEQLVPPVCATVIVTGAFLQFAKEAVNALPGLWMMMAALACFAMVSSIGNRLRYVGAWYLICGTAVLITGLKAPAVMLSEWLVAVPFFIGQLGMALVLKLESRSNNATT